MQPNLGGESTWKYRSSNCSNRINSIANAQKGFSHWPGVRCSVWDDVPQVWMSRCG